MQSQTERDFEHIVIDGGSTDGTVDWLKGQSRYVNWISEPDSGVAHALNKGVEWATGDWILVLQADDTFLSENSLARGAERLASEAQFVCFDVEFRSESGSRTLRTHGLSPRLYLKSLPHQGVFTRSSVFEALGLFDTSLSVCFDYEFFLRAYKTGMSCEVWHVPLTEMPNTGISSRLDWPSQQVRFGEERLIQMKHSESSSLTTFYRAYWPAYLTYRWMRQRLLRYQRWFTSE